MTPGIDVDELIARPLDAIARLRVDLEAQGGDAGDESAAFATVISEKLCSGASPALEKVPMLCRESIAEGKLPPNCLVRYRGMVQDQYDPEYFVGSFDEVETATGRRSRVEVKYVDNITHRPGVVNEYDNPGATTMDRLPLFCVPVPGLSQWARPSIALKTDHNCTGNGERQDTAGGLPKRPRSADSDAMDCSEEGDNTGANDQSDVSTSGPKRKTQRPSESVSGEDGTLDGNASSSGRAGTAATAFHHEQVIKMAGLACVVKLYDFREGHIKLNDTVEFVGVLGYDHSPPMREETLTEGGAVAAASVNGNPFQGLEEFSPKAPPPSLAPRLHCIFYRMLPACDPLRVDPKQPKDALYALQGPLPFSSFMRDTKRQAIVHLAKVLGGDVLAAEYVLMALLSRVYARTESLAPGSLSVNLRGVRADDAPVIHAAVSDLVPKCVTVPITTQSLSEKFSFAPKKDYEADRLMLSQLQLSEGTVVLLDETKLEAGGVGEEGAGNIRALQSLLSLQKIPYDFCFYKMDFEVDHPTVSLSPRDSLFPAGATVPVVGSGATDSDSAVHAGDKGETLGRLRVYVEATRRVELCLDEVSSKFAEEDFVKARQQGQALTGEDFHRMLTIARLTALSLGDVAMNASHWSHMKDLEAQVAQRVKETGPSADGTAAIPPAQSMPLNAIPENC